MKHALPYTIIGFLCLVIFTGTPTASPTIVQAQIPAAPPPQPTLPPLPPVTISQPPVEPLSIKISGPRHPTLGDRPVWVAEVRGDAGTPRWRVSPPTTGIVEKFGGQVIEWEPPYAGEFTLYVSVGGANKTSADDTYNIIVHPLGPDAPPPQQIQQPPMQLQPQTQQQEGRLASLPRDKAFWNGRVGELVSNVGSNNKVAEARAIGGVVLNLIFRVERDNFGGTEFTDDLRRATIALLGPQRAAPWDAFFAGLGRDLTLQDLRYIENALAHVVLAASRGSSGGKTKTARET